VQKIAGVDNPGTEEEKLVEGRRKTPNSCTRGKDDKDLVFFQSVDRQGAFSNIMSSLINLLRRLKQDKDCESSRKLLMLGLDNSGKTTILKMLGGENSTSVSVTKGFNVKSIIHNKIKISIWDIGGHKTIRPYWRTFFDLTDALIYVVDSSDEVRMKESKSELRELLREKRLHCVPFIVSLTTQEVGDNLSLFDIAENRTWTIQPCSVNGGEGIREGMDWIVERINEN
jgi:small GTP-binding protein